MQLSQCLFCSGSLVSFGSFLNLPMWDAEMACGPFHCLWWVLASMCWLQIMDRVTCCMWTGSEVNCHGYHNTLFKVHRTQVDNTILDSETSQWTVFALVKLPLGPEKHACLHQHSGGSSTEAAVLRVGCWFFPGGAEPREQLSSHVGEGGDSALTRRVKLVLLTGSYWKVNLSDLDLEVNCLAHGVAFHLLFVYSKEIMMIFIVPVICLRLRMLSFCSSLPTLLSHSVPWIASTVCRGP